MNTLRKKDKLIVVFLTCLLFSFNQKANSVEKPKTTNQPPVVRIIAPKNGAVFKVGERVVFEGKATDLEDGEISGRNLIWTSDLNGRIGEGSYFSYDKLLVGIHIIVLTVTDSGNSQGKHSIFITVGAQKTLPMKEAEPKDKPGLEKKVEPIKPQPEKPKPDKPVVEKSLIEDQKIVKKGLPSIEFTFIPAFGSFEDLKGRILNANPKDFAVVVFIMRDIMWWTKPSRDIPVTKINSDGIWTCDITTNKFDELAIKIVAYLIPQNYKPPVATGNFRIPQELEKNSLAKVEVTRKIAGKIETKNPVLVKEESDAFLTLDDLCDELIPETCWLLGIFRVGDILAKPNVKEKLLSFICGSSESGKELIQKIGNMENLIVFFTLDKTLGMIFVFNPSGTEELLSIFKENTEQIDKQTWQGDDGFKIRAVNDRTLFLLYSETGDSFENILSKSRRVERLAIVNDVIGFKDKGDIVFSFYIEQLRQSSEIWREMLADDEFSEDLISLLKCMESIAFQFRIEQKCNLNVDIKCVDEQSIQVFSQKLQLFQLMLSEAKEKTYVPEFSFRPEGLKLIVTLEFELEKAIELIQNIENIERR